MELSSKVIKSFVINLRKRTDRKLHIENEFNGKTEFNLCIVDARENIIGRLGLWETIQYIVTDLTSPNDQCILICEDDHIFTEFYSQEVLQSAINECISKEVSILLGGISWFNDAIQISSNLFWVDRFSGLQFVMIFKNAFQQIKEIQFTINDSADLKLSEVLGNKLVIHPYISRQKEFGYSDVTRTNDQCGYVDSIFEDSSERFTKLSRVLEYYKRPI